MRGERPRTHHSSARLLAPSTREPPGPNHPSSVIPGTPHFPAGLLSAWKAGFYTAPIALSRALQQGPTPYSTGAQLCSLCPSPPRFPIPAQRHVASFSLPWQPDAAAASPVATTAAAPDQITRVCGRQGAAVGQGEGTECRGVGWVRGVGWEGCRGHVGSPGRGVWGQI